LQHLSSGMRVNSLLDDAAKGAITAIATTSENISAARSSILDADYTKRDATTDPQQYSATLQQLHDCSGQYPASKRIATAKLIRQLLQVQTFTYSLFNQFDFIGLVWFTFRSPPDNIGPAKI